MWWLHQVLSFADYLVRAKTPAQMHSPYLFELLQQIHDPERQYYVFSSIESCRRAMLEDEASVSGEDHGAGSKKGGNRTVQHIARTSLSSPVKCQTIFRLICQHKPGTILELGTSLGIMTAYLAAACPGSKVDTIEGNPELSAYARNIATGLEIGNIAFHSGRFSDILPGLLQGTRKFDFVLIDGDHRGNALKTYFSMIRSAVSQDAIVMIDDIRWSGDMYAAWKEISHVPDVTCSLDYFSFGLLFFRKDFVDNVHLQVIPARLPPMIL